MNNISLSCTIVDLDTLNEIDLKTNTILAGFYNLFIFDAYIMKILKILSLESAIAVERLNKARLHQISLSLTIVPQVSHSENFMWSYFTHVRPTALIMLII